jgi:hypothetical protein
MKHLGMLLAALLAFAGEAPAAPARHLEYAFAVYPTPVGNAGYYNGTLSVDILGTAPDGGMLVRASEWWYYTLRPRQPRQCEVYPGGAVRCDDVPPYPSESELALFPLLARDFFSGGLTETASSWERSFPLTFKNGLYVTTVSMSLSAKPQNNGGVVEVTSSGVFQQLDRRKQKSLEAGRFLYDQAASVPVLVHEVLSPTPTQTVFSQTAVDLQLTKDSAMAPNDTALAQLGKPRFQITQAGIERPAIRPGMPSPAATTGPDAESPR